MLEDGSNLIDPSSSSLKVTLDLICLTLPPEMESSKSWKVADEGALAHDASEMDDGFLVDEHGSIAEDQLKQGVFELNDDKEMAPAPGEKARFAPFFLVIEYFFIFIHLIFLSSFLFPAASVAQW